ncbi:MAG TPA: single-stranded DNA-binding protein [Edaphobacter sp.]|nr:single-stranded DNA-binding protein [Edaphobacter sp.]
MYPDFSAIELESQSRNRLDSLQSGFHRDVPQSRTRCKDRGRFRGHLSCCILIGRLGKNAEDKTAQNNKEYVVLNIETQESWKNDKGNYENCSEWHRVYAWRNHSKFAKTLQKGQLVTLEGILRYREVEDEVKGVSLQAPDRRDPRS